MVTDHGLTGLAVHKDGACVGLFGLAHGVKTTLALELCARGWSVMHVGDATLPDPPSSPSGRYLTHAVVLERCARGGASLELLSPAVAATDILQFVTCARDWPRTWMTLDALRYVACYRLRTDDAEKGADLIDGLVRLLAWM